MKEENKIDNPLKFIVAAVQAQSQVPARIHCTFYKCQLFNVYQPLNTYYYR